MAPWKHICLDGALQCQSCFESHTCFRQVQSARVDLWESFVLKLHSMMAASTALPPATGLSSWLLVLLRLPRPERGKAGDGGL